MRQGLRKGAIFILNENCSLCLCIEANAFLKVFKYFTNLDIKRFQSINSRANDRLVLNKNGTVDFEEDLSPYGKGVTYKFPIRNKLDATIGVAGIFNKN